MNESDELGYIIRRLFCAMSIQDRITAAKVLITKYDLPFNTDDLIKARDHFETIRWHTVSTLIRIALTNNPRMFIAIIYALLNKYNGMSNMWPLYLYFKPFEARDHVLGCNW